MVAGIAAFFVAVGIILRVCRRPLLWLWRRVVAEPLTIWFRALIRAEVGPIVREMSRNGGSTIKDKVDHIAEVVGKVVPDHRAGGRRSTDPPKDELL